VTKHLILIFAITFLTPAAGLPAESSADRCARLLKEAKDLVWEAHNDSAQAPASKQQHKEALRACQQDNVPHELLSRAYLMWANQPHDTPAASIAILKEGLARVEKKEGSDTPASLLLLDHLASRYNSDETRAEGRALTERALVIRKKYFGEISEEAAIGTYYLAVLDENDGLGDALAEKRYREAVDIARKACGMKRPCESLGTSLSGLARIMRKDPARVEQADAMLDEIIEALDGPKQPKKKR
jgi:hypothetical protein